jgi:hypothetical protein
MTDKNIVWLKQLREYLIFKKILRQQHIRSTRINSD